MRACACISVCTCAHVCICVHVRARMHVCTCTCVHTRAHVCPHEQVLICFQNPSELTGASVNIYYLAFFFLKKKSNFAVWLLNLFLLLQKCLPSIKMRGFWQRLCFSCRCSFLFRGKGASVRGSWPHFLGPDIPSSSPGGLKSRRFSSSCRGVTVPGLSRPKSCSLGQASPWPGLSGLPRESSGWAPGPSGPRGLSSAAELSTVRKE